MIYFGGKRILVTGAASGIGRETCALLAAFGAEVIGLDLNEAELEKTSGLSGRVVIDLRDLHLIAPALIQFQASRLHGLVHAAGVPCSVQLRELQPIRYHDVMTVNAAAALELSRAFLQSADQRGGSIVYVSSVMGTVGAHGAAAYAASKAALNGLARSLALELAVRRIRVNCVAPGFVDTPMTRRTISYPTQWSAVEELHPLGIGDPKDVANAIAFLLSDAARWITGSVLVCDGGYTAR